jgi:hypothetical protein
LRPPSQAANHATTAPSNIEAAIENATTFGIRTGQSGNPAHKLHQICAVFGRDAAMAGGSKQDAAGFRTLWRGFRIGIAARRTEQAVELVAQQRLSRAGGGGGACGRSTAQRCACEEGGDENGQHHGDRPGSHAMDAVFVLDVAGISRDRVRSDTAGGIAAHAETDQGHQYQVKA